jgi:tetratricopeptide (TPR) repeat protein
MKKKSNKVTIPIPFVNSHTLVSLQHKIDNLFHKGFKLHQTGDLDEAEKMYVNILSLNSKHFDSLHLLGVIHYQKKNYNKAIQLLDLAIQLNPYISLVSFNRGLILHALNRFNEALESYDLAIKINPNYADAFFNRGNILQELKRFDEALESYDFAIKINPNYASAFFNRGNIFKDFNRLNEALDSYNFAIKINPNYASAFLNRGNILQEFKRFDEALESYDLAIKINPNYADAFFNRGNIFKEFNRFNEALESYDLAIKINPNYADAFFNRGIILQELKRFDEALESYDLAIKINPNYVDAFVNRGNTLQELKRFYEALESNDLAIKINPNFAELFYNRGIILQELKRFDEAFDSYDFAIKINPDYADAYWNKSLSLLLLGKVELGWQLFEWRWKREPLLLHSRCFSQPLWLGQEELHGKTMLLHAEQGLGDTIQFCRYAKLVKARGAHVILEVPQALVGLLSQLEGVDELIPTGSTLPDFDYHCPLMSLPLAFKTELNSIPSSTKYISADLNKSKEWRHKLGPTEKLKVGVVWNGGFRANQPKVWSVNERRNIQLSIFSSYLKDVDVDFYSLQKGDPAESEIKGRELDFWPNGNFYNFMGEVNDFTDTAALIDNLDLVIAVDTSTAHLAAAMGKPTWILNRFDSCWRWLLDRNDSPWYESVKLYRQDESRDWAAVMTQVVQDLKSMC